MVSKLSSDTINLTIPFSKISDLNEKNEDEFLSKLIKVFKPNNIKDLEKINFQLISYFKEYKEKIICLNKISDYLKTFEPKDNEKLINTLENIINNLRKRNIKDILNEKKQNNIYLI